MVKEFPDVIIAALQRTSFILKSNANALYYTVQHNEISLLNTNTTVCTDHPNTSSSCNDFFTEYLQVLIICVTTLRHASLLVNDTQ